MNGWVKADAQRARCFDSYGFSKLNLGFRGLCVQLFWFLVWRTNQLKYLGLQLRQDNSEHYFRWLRLNVA